MKIFHLIFDAQSLLMITEEATYQLIIPVDVVDVFNEHFSYPRVIFVLQSQGNFDHEQMLDALSDPSKNGDMVAWSGVLLLVENTISADRTLCNLNIYIIDKNDNVPLFKQPYRFNITIAQELLVY